MQFTVEFQEPHLWAALRGAKGAIDRPAKLLGPIGLSLLRENQRRHDQGLAPDGSAWTPLAKSTLHAVVDSRRNSITKPAGKIVGPRSDFRAAHKAMAGKQILKDTGDLLKFYYQVEGQEVVISTMDQRKAGWHHFGTGKHGPKGSAYEIRPKVAKALAFGGLVRNRVSHPGVPARPLVGFPDSDRKMVATIVGDYLVGAFKKT